MRRNLKSLFIATFMAATFASANAQAASFSINQLFLDFGQVEVGSSSAPLNFVYETFADVAMNEELIFIDLNFSGDTDDFNAIQNRTACEPPGTGGICDLDFRFAPLSTGLKSGLLIVSAFFEDMNNNGFTLQASAEFVGEGTLPTNVIPLPAALPLFAGGLGLMGLMGWRKKQAATV